MSEPRKTLRYDVVIVGGGFAGVACGRELGREARHSGGRFNAALISDDNHMTFQPMLPEVASASVSPRHVVNPLRMMCRGLEVLKGSVRRIDPEKKCLHLNAGDFTPDVPVYFDQLALVPGAVIDLSRVPGMTEHALLMQNVGDAMKLRATIIARFEEANLVLDTERRQRLLRFVVVGGGYSGVETAGEIHDLMVEMHRWYRNVQREDFDVVLVHSRATLLPTLTSDLGDYAKRHLEKRGLRIITERRVKSVTSNSVRLDNDEVLSANTVISTIGNGPHPLILSLTEKLSLDADHGRLKAEQTTRVPKCEWLWTAGDCASIPTKNGEACPATAQFAQRQGKLMGKNIIAAYHGKSLKTFDFTGLGELAAIGHHTAVADIKGMKFSGFLAWWMWRTIYLAKLPGIQRKLRIMIDWTFDLFFPRDINLLNPRYSRPLRAIHLEPGDVLFNPGEPAFSMYFVKKGCIDIHDDARVVKTLRDGEYFGERALLEDRKWRYQAVARQATTLVGLGATEFYSIVEGSSALRRLFERSAQAYANTSEMETLRRQLSRQTLRMPANRIMNTEVDTLQENQTLGSALDLFKKKRHGSYPVINKEGRLKGVVRRDELYDALKRDPKLSEHDVSSLHIDELPTAHEEATGEELIEKFMRTGRNKILIVGEDGKLEGLVTLIDLVEADAVNPAASSKPS